MIIRYLAGCGVVGALLTASAGAQTPTAGEVFEKTRAAYASLKAVHLVAEREETGYAQGRTWSVASGCELAAMGNRYYARFRSGGVEGVVAGDGTTIWRALVSKKQWTKMSAASIAGSNDEDESAEAPSKDLHGVLMSTLLNHFAAVLKSARDPVMVKRGRVQARPRQGARLLAPRPSRPERLRVTAGPAKLFRVAGQGGS